MRKLLYTVSYTILVLSLYGCASGEPIQLRTMMSNSLYARDCMGPNSRYRQGDPECVYMGEPMPMTGKQKYLIPKPDRMDVKVITACRWDGREDGFSELTVRNLKQKQAEYRRAGVCG